jgi:4-diphosphocytidyl-2-C-methyl-D-erythritol kinase
MLTNIQSSNAKINLALYINHKRSDGYHDISTLMQEINFSDEITISKNKNNQINIYSKGIKTPIDETNLCYVATNIFRDMFNITDGINITINKKIPIGAGLGGGSSNAISTLKALGKIFGVDMGNNNLLSMAAKIGADVPFFINGRLQYAEGIGHVLDPMPPLFKSYIFLLVLPKIYISTSWAYGAYKKYLEIKSNQSKFQPLSCELDWSLLRNDFEKVVLSTYPEIKRIKNDLQNSGSLFSSLSGSGSTMFGVYDNLESVNTAKDLFNKYQTYTALPIY